MTLVRIAAGILISGLLFVPVRANLGTRDVYALRSNIKIGVGSSPRAIAIDGAGSRAFVATARGLFVVDLEKQRVLGQAASFSNVRAIALTADRRRIAAALADGYVAIVDITPRNVTKVRTDLTSLDLMALEPSSSTIFAVAHGGKTVAIVNVETKLESSIEVDGAVDSLTAAGGRAFVLLRDDRVQVIDAAQQRVIATWSAGKLADVPPVVATDDTGERLFVGADTDIFMVASATGTVLGRVNVPSRVRSIGYDATRSLMVATSYREGFPSPLTVATTASPASIRVVEQIDLPAGAGGGLHIDSSTGVFAATASEIALRDAPPAIQSPRPVLKQSGPAPGHFLLLIYKHAD